MRKKLLLSVFTLLSLWVGSSGLKAQTGNNYIWGTSPFQDSLWSIDTTSWSVVNRFGPTLAGFTITGMNGMAYDPCEHEIYLIMKVSSVTGRVLGKIDLGTGVCTQVGNLGDNFATINFREDGQLFGVTGNGATVPETMYLIDKTNGTKTLAAALGAGADGEVISYNYDDDFFYHWSGNGTIVYEKVMSVAPYTATNVPIIGTTNGETFGAIYLGSNKFIISNISSSFNRCNAAGNWAGPMGSNPDDLRGLVMPPNFRFTEDSICAGTDASWIYGGFVYNDSLIYNWGDGSSDTLLTGADATHTYTSAGTYTTYAILTNACSGADTMATATIEVIALPSVIIDPNPAYICAGDTGVTFNSVGDTGTYQWYGNGLMLAGETNSSYTTSTLGIYNLIVTNSLGCSDSASVGAELLGNAPSIDFTSPATDSSSFCAGGSRLLEVTAGQVSYDWLLNGTLNTTTAVNSLSASTVGTWKVATLFANCPDTTNPGLVLSEDPLTTASYNQSAVTIFVGGSVNFTNTSIDATSFSWTFQSGTPPTSTSATPTVSYSLAGVFDVTLVSSNSCGSDTSTSTVTVTDTGAFVFAPTLGGYLMTNQPNPFSDQTTFVVESRNAGQVSLVVYNTTGQIVKVLFDGVMPAGKNQINWNGSNANGETVAAGMYHAVLRNDKGMISRSVTMVK
jgi:PKD repeat protein